MSCSGLKVSLILIGAVYFSAICMACWLSSTITTVMELLIVIPWYVVSAYNVTMVESVSYNSVVSDDRNVFYIVIGQYPLMHCSSVFQS